MASTLDTQPELTPLSEQNGSSETPLSGHASPSSMLFSVGTKMVAVSAFLFLFSFLVAGMGTFSLARRMLQADLEVKVAQESSFLATASHDLVVRANAQDRERLTRLAEALLVQPEILSVQVLDHERHILASSAKAKRQVPDFFSLTVPIRTGSVTIGFVRAWYSPVIAADEFWATTGNLILILFCATFFIFALLLLAANDRLLVKPFHELFGAIDEADRRRFTGRLITRRDEWGVIGNRLTQFLSRLVHLEERASLLYDTSRLLDAPGGLAQSLDIVFSGLVHRYKLSSAILFTANEDRQTLRADYAIGLSSEFTRNLTVRRGEGLAGVVYASGIVRVTADASTERADALLGEMIGRHQTRSALWVPLKVEGEILGTAVYFSREAAAFGEEQIQALNQFTDYIASALRNSKRYLRLETDNRRLETEVASVVRELTQSNSRLVQKVKELKTVYELALATAASGNVEDIIQVIISGAKDLVDVQSGAFFFFGKSSGFLEPAGPAFDQPSANSSIFGCKIEESKFLQRVVKEGRTQMLNFVDAAEQLPESWKGLAIRSILAIPLMREGQLTGVFCVINKINGLFTEDDIRLLSLLTGRVTEVLQRMALDQQLRQRVNDLSVLQEIGAQLPNIPVLADTVHAIGRITRSALPGVDICLFFLHHADSEALVMMGGDWDPKIIFDPRSLTIGSSQAMPLADVFRESQPAQYEKGGSSAVWDADEVTRTFDLQSLLYLPLSVDQGRIGVMAIGSRQTMPFDHRRLAGLIAKQVAIVIERSRLYERLRSANEKLEQMNHLKNEFISMVSHELRTPLTTIKGFVSIVLNEETGPLNDQQRRFLETSDRAIDRLTLLVSDLLDISRIEAGQIKMQLRPISLRDVAARTDSNFAPQLKAQNLKLTINLPDTLPLVLADPDRLQQVFDNLISNALKYTTEGGITISAIDRGDFVMVSVKDTGSGIAKGEQDKIFEKFYQIKVGNAYPTKGTGLGLAIVRSIVESHRGKVWVESEAGKGADFRFMLPRAKQETLGEGK